MIPRHIEAILRTRLATVVPAVVLLGPRQVGKTTLARKLASDWPGGAVYLDMERPADRRRLDDADAYLRAQSGKLVVIDEIQRAPGLFEVLRGIIDDRRAGGERFGHFLLLGSAALELMRQSSETLAGRVAYLEIGPVDILEANAASLDAQTLWLRGGFPESLLAPGDGPSLDWRRDFIRSYLERDVPMFAPRMPVQALGRLWTMLAHQQGGLLNQARLAAGLGVSAPTVTRYTDLMVDLQLVRRLAPWSGNVGKRLVKAPKVYVRDSGIVHALLDLETSNDLLGHPVVGPSYEGFVIENLIQCAGPRWKPYFYRTHDGAEIDLLLERGGQPEIAIEIKRSSAPSLDKGFGMACDDLKVRQRYVVYPGEESYPVRHGAQAMSLTALARQMQAA
ncbi:MAG: ATP-binding protein [Polaromonas sp.]|uniref:ATP-binding protein n=1 Tax=Polaromonas sp. TaxID=1869339 RepID=UPI002730AD68|nr:ATP-binding protein [Polaromonas sp.]MDP2448732.1 ATP-binding protein [Polaromonas sp.]MDP3248628.1 ATP-binding protein [Polaromonas sp.]MDP3758052.1 ATP-binding protein [Polaromonas sp.]